jgi:hypothetical protein
VFFGNLHLSIFFFSNYYGSDDVYLVSDIFKQKNVNMVMLKCMKLYG